MKFNIGDKVKFLNESGGGVVSKIISTTMVEVTIEDGFNIPVMTGELVIDSIAEAARSEDKKQPMDRIQEEVLNQPRQEMDYKSGALLKHHMYDNPEKGIYLAYIPQDQQWLITGNIDIYLVNHTPHDVLFCMYLEDEEEKLQGSDYDVVGPSSKFLIESIERDDLPGWTKGIVQLMFFTSGEDLIEPRQVRFRIKSGRFVHENHYKNFAFFDEKAFVYELLKTPRKKTMPKKTVAEEQKEDIQVAEESKAKEVQTNEIIDKHMQEGGMVEIDLHIESLVDNADTMQPHKILQYQLKYFEESLKSAIERKLDSIIFIHGSGKGLLRAEIIKKIDEYEGLHYFDASFRKYGGGAIEVYLKRIA